MTDNSDATMLVEPGLYNKTFSDIDRLRMVLPEPALELLAREVLKRMSQKAPSESTLSEEVIILTDALIGPDSTAAAHLVDKFHRAGTDIKSIHLDYLAPAAEMLGHRWDNDIIQFADVTVGTGRIYAIIRNLASRFPPPRLLNARHALFAAIPGDDHTLGIRMAAELARKEGWDIELIVGCDHDELVDRILRSDHLIIGLSGGGEHALTELARLALSIQVSQPAALLLVSGSIASKGRGALELMQIDAIESDFDLALGALERFWTKLSVNAA